MPSIQTLIGKRFEVILKEMYPDLDYIGDEDNLVPDFEHPLFYAEAKVSYFAPDYASHLKQYQIEAFKEFEKKKPVLYLIGSHNFEDSMKRLSPLNLRQRQKKLDREMGIMRLFLVDNSTITKIWDKRNYVCERGHIHDCTLRDSHLRQIIENSQIRVNGKKHSARDYYNILSKDYLFSLPKESNGIEIGHIIPSKINRILEFFYL